MKSRKTKPFSVVVSILLLLCLTDAYAQRYGNRFMIAPDYYFNHFTIDKIGQQIYADLYGGRVYKIDLRTMEVDTTSFTDMAPVFGSPVFGNKRHIMFWGGKIRNMDTGSLYKLPIPDSPKYVGSLYYMFSTLFSPNDSNIMFSLISPTPPYLVNGYIFSLKDSSLTQIDTSVNFTAESNGLLVPQWSSDTSFIYGISDSCLVEYFIGSRSIDTLVTLHNYSKITSFAYNTKENILAYGASAWIAPNFDERIYFYYRNSTSDSLVFSLQRDCSSIADVLIWLSWSPDNDRLGFLAYSSINEVTSIYFYSMDSSRAYRATEYCNDPDKKYELEWANGDTLVYFDAEDYYLYGMDISSMIDAIHENKNEPVATDFSLSSYPNPFNPRTTISYQLPVASDVTLEIYDALGRKVATLIRHERQAAGTHVIHWNATNDNNEKIASGSYLVALKIDDSRNQNRKVTKLIYLK